MVESAYDAHYVTVIDVHIEIKQQGNRREVEWWPQFRVVDTATVTPDPEVAAVVAGYQQELDRQMNVPLDTTAVALDSRNATVRGREAAIGNLIADAMRERTRADVAIMNGGGIRGGKVYEPGTPITRRDVLAELPFGNHLVTLDVKGSELRQAIENGLSRLPGARRPVSAGVRPDGSSSIRGSRPAAACSPSPPAARRSIRTRPTGSPTNDFMARGGDGYTAFAAVDPLVPLEDTPLLAERSDDLSARTRQRAHRRRRPHHRQMKTPPRGLRGGAF